MRGRWAAGLPPRHFAWVLQDELAVSERPGGHARTHRRVRRQEEIIWLRENSFTRVVSLLTSPHNLHAYDEVELPWSRFPIGPSTDLRAVLPDLYTQVRDWLAGGERLLVHHEELGDVVLGVAAGYLWWVGKLQSGPQAIAAVERLLRQSIGPIGRAVVAAIPELPGPSPLPATIGP